MRLFIFIKNFQLKKNFFFINFKLYIIYNLICK